MYRIKVFICFILITTWPVKAQESIDFTSVDSLTWKLYQGKDWKNLAHIGKKALKNGIDYYYLRMRIGIAHYETGNYMKSAKHFNKALDFNTGDPVALEYLFYSNIFSGRTDHAWSVAKGFSPALKEKIGTAKKKSLEKLHVEFCHENSFTDDIVSNPANYFSNIPGYQIITRHFNNVSLFADHRAGYRFRIFHGYTYLNKSNLFHYNDGMYILNDPDYVINQHQYYFSLNTSFNNGWKITPAVHFLSVKYSKLLSISAGGPNGLRAIYGMHNTFNLLAGLSVSKYIENTSLTLEGHYSNLNENEQVQTTMGMIYYPLGNLNVYVGGNFTLHNQINQPAEELNMIGIGKFGFSIAQKAWFELSGSWGSMKNYSEFNTYLVFNNYDKILQKYNLHIIIPVNENGSLLYFGSRFVKKSCELYSFTTQDYLNTENINYNSLSLYGGLSWNF